MCSTELGLGFVLSWGWAMGGAESWGWAMCGAELGVWQLDSFIKSPLSKGQEILANSLPAQVRRRAGRRGEREQQQEERSSDGGKGGGGGRESTGKGRQGGRECSGEGGGEQRMMEVAEGGRKKDQPKLWREDGAAREGGDAEARAVDSDERG
eukprot:1994564-Rhodomonas_salina.1